MTELGPGYVSHTFDAMRPVDLLADEVRQRRQTGYDVDALVQEANRTDPGDRDAVLDLVDRMSLAERLPGWTYVEPDELADIEDSLDGLPRASAVPEAELADRIQAAWLGRIAGCNIGKPVESGDYWTTDRIRDYLLLTDSYPLRDYVPALDPMPDGFRLTSCWPETTRGNVHGSARDDDIDYAILALHLLETHGDDLRTEDVGAAWTRLFPIGQVFTAERAAYLNLVNGFTVPEVARRRNPYREWIGAQIRG
ncbi:ADP-ribosylglycohydrolase family protein, partial [Kribbella sp.]|uniref:ADP-ribosylglycohydrolase family protein n=1 Tax=Kribbella sp. TaxID=1871183 RepID=UPI002D33D940